jgi:tRNA 2-thiouridine synthesizing protein B
VILHTLHCSPSSAAFADLLRVLAQGDSVLLLGDGVYAAIAGSTALAELSAREVTIHALAQDVAAAAVGSMLDGSIALADYAGFVALTEACPRQLAWY